MLAIPEGLKVVELLSPATDAAGRTGTYLSLKNVKRAWIVAYITQGNAATVLLSPYQATVVAGTDGKVLANAVPIWSDLDCAASDTLTKRTAAVNYTTDAGVKHKIVIFQIDPSQLDLANGFDCITLVTGASNVANITSALALLEMRYQGDASPSVIAD